MRQAAGQRRRLIAREAGTALAVIAVYILVLLLPLHQAAALQRDLSALGYETVGTWSICQQSAPAGSHEVPTAVKCPAAGVAKQQLAAILPASIGVEAPIEAGCTGHPAPGAGMHAWGGLAGNPRQTRAPPAQS